MPSAEEDVRSRLGSYPAVTALVGDRLYPSRIPEHDAPTPWVYYTVPASEPVEQLNPNGSQDTRHTFEFSVFAETYLTGLAVARTLRQALDGWRGGCVKRSLWAGQSSEPVDDGYGFTVAFTVRAYEPIPVTTADATTASADSTAYTADLG
jgi:hypothetical protein